MSAKSALNGILVENLFQKRYPDAQSVAYVFCDFILLDKNNQAIHIEVKKASQKSPNSWYIKLGKEQLIAMLDNNVILAVYYPPLNDFYFFNLKNDLIIRGFNLKRLKNKYKTLGVKIR